MIKKFLIASLMSIFLSSAILSQAATGTVVLGWGSYVSPAGVIIKLYSTPGTNAVFTAGNANGTLLGWTGATNSSYTVNNVPVGTYTFVAVASTAVSGGLDSTNSNTAWTNVYPGAVINLRVVSSTP